MTTEHPVPKDFERFLTDGTPQTDVSGRPLRSRLVRHLLAECPECRASLHAVGWPEDRIEKLFRFEPVDSDAANRSERRYAYDEVFSRAECSLSELLTADHPLDGVPEEHFAAIAPLPFEEQLHRVRSERPFAHPQMVRWLVAKSHATRYRDTASMLRWAQLAQAAADACSPSDSGNLRRLEDLRCQAWSQLGNALRVAGKLPEAEDAFAQACAHRDRGTGDPVLQARLCGQMASFKMIFQQNFASAVELADRAAQIYREIGDTHQLAGTLVQKATFLLYSGEAGPAAQILNKAIPLMDQEEDPLLLLAACHNLVVCYAELDQPDHGLALYSQAKDLYQDFKDPLIHLRIAWQEGRLLLELGHLQAAESAFLRTREGFAELSLAYEGALVALDLATVYARRSAVAELRQAVAEALPVFRALRVSQEVLASLLQLQQVADQEEQALEIIRFVSAQLDRVPGRQGPSMPI